MIENFEFNYEYSGCKFCYSKTKRIGEREIHDYLELLYYIDGGATLKTETFNQKLKENSLILIPKGKFHSVALENPNNFTRLKISFDQTELLKDIDPKVLDEVSIISNLSPSVISLLDKTCACLENQTCTNNNNLFIYGAFLVALSEFSSNVNVENGQKNLSLIVKETIRYVEENISEDLSIESISANLNFSESTLSHSFKKEMGVSIHKYVVQKRLIYAKELLCGGKLPTEIYCLCGYTNYSSFYKAYVKTWGTNPKQN